MFERLRSYYQSVGISAMDFHCQGNVLGFLQKKRRELSS